MQEETTRNHAEIKAFDYDGWEGDGKKGLEDLTARKEKLEKELGAVNAQIARLKVLFGKNESKQKKKKPKIRPVLKKILSEFGEKGCLVSNLIDNTIDNLGAELSTVEAALNRWVASDNKIVIVEIDGEKIIRPSSTPLP